jgi:hypothetical protein
MTKLIGFRYKFKEVDGGDAGYKTSSLKPKRDRLITGLKIWG